MYQENNVYQKNNTSDPIKQSNDSISLLEYIQALRSVLKEYNRSGLLLLSLIFGVVFVIIYIIFDPSINFFIYTIIGILIIIGLESFSNINTIIDKVEKMQIYTLDEFKHAFRKAFKQQCINDIKIYIPIYILIMGILTNIHFTHYPKDTWFIYILAIMGLYILYILIVSTINYVLDEFFKTIEKEAEMKAIIEK